MKERARKKSGRRRRLENETEKKRRGEKERNKGGSRPVRIQKTGSTGSILVPKEDKFSQCDQQKTIHFNEWLMRG